MTTFPVERLKTWSICLESPIFTFRVKEGSERHDNDDDLKVRITLREDYDRTGGSDDDDDDDDDAVKGDNGGGTKGRLLISTTTLTSSTHS